MHLIPFATVVDPGQSVSKLGSTGVRLLAILVIVGAVTLVISARHGKRLLKHAFYGLVAVVVVVACFGLLWDTAVAGVTAVLSIAKDVFAGVTSG